MATTSKKPKASAQIQSYLSKLAPNLRAQVLRLGEIIRSAAPEAVESFGYGMPAFALDGKDFIWYGAWKQHLSLYPLNDAMRLEFAAEVSGYDTSGKGTIRFRADEELPASLIVRLVESRVRQVRPKSGG